MEKTKICLINDSFPPAIDGVANAVVNYGTYIAKNHGEAVVVTPFYPDADDTVFPFPVVRYPSIDVTRSVGYRAGMPFDAEVLADLEKRNFDLIHTHCPHPLIHRQASEHLQSATHTSAQKTLQRPSL